MGFLHIWHCLHIWICSFSSSTQILLIPTTYSGKLSNWATCDEQHLLILLNQRLGRFPCGPSPLLWGEQTEHLCPFFFCLSSFYRPSSASSDIPFQDEFWSPAFLVIPHLEGGLCLWPVLFCFSESHSFLLCFLSWETEQEWLNQDVQGEPWINTVVWQYSLFFTCFSVIFTVRFIFFTAA